MVAHPFPKTSHDLNNGVSNASSALKKEDGGYYAIKGFLYQFDVTILNILRYLREEIQFEQVQDINFDKFVIQIKNRETQDYSPSKIRPAIKQLLDIFCEDQTKQLVLYCHFKNKVTEEWALTVEDLDKILGGGTCHTIQ